MVWKKIRLDPEEIYAKIPDIKEGDILQIEIPRHASKLVPADRIYVRVDRRIPRSSAALRWFLGWTRENAIRGTLIDKNGTEYVPVVIKTHFAPVPDDIRRLLLAGVELFSVEKKIGGREKTPVRASIQIYVPAGKKEHFLGEVARAEVIPRMLGKYFLRIGDQTQDNVRMASTDGDVLRYDEVRSGEVARTIYGRYDIARILEDVAQDLTRSSIWWRLRAKLRGISAHEQVLHLPAYLWERRVATGDMVAATRDYTEYLGRYYHGKVNENVAKKTQWLEGHMPKYAKINPFRHRPDRKTAELWNWLVAHHEARIGAAKAIMYRYLKETRDG